MTARDLANGSPVTLRFALSDAIVAQTVAACTKRYGSNLRAIILTGSLARNEATRRFQHGYIKVLGDAEFVIIFNQGVRLPHPRDIVDAQKEIETALATDGIRCEIGLNRSNVSYLRSIRPHIFGYELMTCGQVVLGDPEILSMIPRFSCSQIPLEDAWRLLQNRMIELLEVSGGLAARPASLPECLHYRIVKLYLDMATSLLLFLGKYAPTYRQRANNLVSLARESCSDWPVDPDNFTATVCRCTEWKLLPEPRGVTGDIEFLQRAIADARLLWRWELSRLTHAGSGASDGELWTRWAAQQSWGKRLRGWLYVLRSEGYLQSFPHWLRWARLASVASPRYWVYRAASDTLFHLAEPHASGGFDDRAGRPLPDIRRFLPVVRKENPAESSCPDPIPEIAWNYHRFLVQTRS